MCERAAPGQLLEQMLEDMNAADPLYKPTHFWELGLPSIVNDLRQRGFDDFRSHPSARWYVGRYAAPWYRDYGGFVRPVLRVADWATGKRTLGARAQRIFEGRPALDRDYRVLFASDDRRPPRLTEVSESDVGRPIERFTVDGVSRSKNLLNYLRGLSFLKRYVDLTAIERVLEIGGGFGSLGEIVLKMSARTFYVDVDIPPLAAVSTYYLRSIFGRDAVYGYDQSRGQSRIDIDALAGQYRAAVLCPWQLPHVEGSADLFVNFISFQEMEPHVVQNYVRHASRLTRRFALLRNSRHGMPRARNGSVLGVIEPTRMDDAIAMFTEFRLVARDTQVFSDANWDKSRVSELAFLDRVRRSPDQNSV